MSWVWRKMGSGISEHLQVVSDEGRLIAKVYPHPGEAPLPSRVSEQDIDNARLIAESPQIFESLSALVQFIDNYGIFDKNGVSHYHDIADILERSRASISKVLGETNES